MTNGSGEHLIVVRPGKSSDYPLPLLNSSVNLLLGVLVSKSTGNPLSAKIVSSSVGGELQDGSLSVLTRRHNLKKRDINNPLAHQPKILTRTSLGHLAWTAVMILAATINFSQVLAKLR